LAKVILPAKKAIAVAAKKPAAIYIKPKVLAKTKTPMKIAVKPVVKAPV
jgi:hypothetical protein